MRAQNLHKRSNEFSMLSVFCALAVCTLSLGGFGREYVAATILNGHEYQTVLGMRLYDPRWLTYSARGLGDLMQKCADAMLTNEAVRLSPQLQQEIGNSCGTAAKAILMDSPGFARAHAVGLIAERANLAPQDYGLASASAPFEPWPLRVRLLAVERFLVMTADTNSGSLPADLVPFVSDDMVRALQTVWGRTLLAGLYVRQTGLRALIETVAKTRPDDEQRAFLNATRNAAAQMATKNG